MHRLRSHRLVGVFTVSVLAVTHVGSTAGLSAEKSAQWLDAYREPSARLIGEAVGSTVAWQRLAMLTDTIGNRLSGSAAEVSANPEVRRAYLGM